MVGAVVSDNLEREKGMGGEATQIHRKWLIDYRDGGEIPV